ncbi:MAG: hypothetical protein ABR520_08405 [Mycobacteriales bacterium]|nr:hypothetical protein [Frankia sp.]
MRATQRVLAGALVLATFIPVGGTVATADTAAPALVQTNWFWAKQVGGTIGPSGVPYPASLQDPTVPAKDVAVAGDPTQQTVEPKGVDKETYLQWDLATIPPMSTVTKFTFVMPIDTSPTAGNGYDPVNPPQLIACTPKGGWTAGAIGPMGDQFSGKPADDCGATAAKGKFDANASTYTFDSTALAQGWVNGEFNFGVAIRHAETYQEPYQLVFASDKIKASIEYTPAVAPPPPPANNGNGLGVGTNTGTGTGYVAGGSSGGTTSGGGGLGTGTTTIPPQPTNTTPPAPPPVVNQPVAPAASRPLNVDKRPTALFWIAVLLGAALLGFTSLVLGDPSVPASTVQTDRGLNRALRRRGVMTGLDNAGGGL